MCGKNHGSYLFQGRWIKMSDKWRRRSLIRRIVLPHWLRKLFANYRTNGEIYPRLVALNLCGISSRINVCCLNQNRIKIQIKFSERRNTSPSFRVSPCLDFTSRFYEESINYIRYDAPSRSFSSPCWGRFKCYTLYNLTRDFRVFVFNGTDELFICECLMILTDIA